MSHLLLPSLPFLRKSGVENINKLIRRYTLKGNDVSKYNDSCIREIETKLNNSSRKNLKYETLLEIMLVNNQFKTLKDFGIFGINKKISSVRLKG